MFCSTIIPTIGRATLSRAVQSVLDQSFTTDDFEVIVINDSGHPLEPAPWQNSTRVRIIETPHRERCVARNAGAAIARGRYLHFLDDDDWLLPNALTVFWQLAHTHPSAAWLYGGCRFEDANGKLLTQVNFGASGNVLARVLAPGQWLPLQASLIHADAFRAVGGFNPHLLVTQDTDLGRRIAIRYDFAESPATIACILRGEGWKTRTDYAHVIDYFRRGRETVLNQPGVWTRLHQSAAEPYWRGRIVRTYLASARWNLKHRRVFLVISRIIFGMATALATGVGIFSRDLWRGIFARVTQNVIPD